MFERYFRRSCYAPFFSTNHTPRHALECSTFLLKYISVAVLFAALAAPPPFKVFQALRGDFSLPRDNTMAALSPLMPVYFLGIGGPNFVENTPTSRLRPAHLGWPRNHDACQTKSHRRDLCALAGWP